MSLSIVPGLFINDVFVCLSAAGDGDMISSASAVVLAAAVGDDMIMSLMVAAFLLTAGADGWLSCDLSMIGSPEPMMTSSVASC